MMTSITNFHAKPFKQLLTSVVLAFWLVAAPAATNKSGALPREAFANCNFSIDFNDLKYFHFEKKIGNEYVCSVAMKPIGFEPLGGMAVDILIMPRSDINGSLNSSGFIKSLDDKWKFTGYPFLKIGPIKYKSLTTHESKEADGTLLIGREIQSGFISQGGPLLISGISIFRTTPSYYLRARLAFETDTPNTTRQAVENEFIKIVKSIEYSDKSASPENHSPE